MRDGSSDQRRQSPEEGRRGEQEQEKRRKEQERRRRSRGEGDGESSSHVTGGVLEQLDVGICWKFRSRGGPDVAFLLAPSHGYDGSVPGTDSNNGKHGIHWGPYRGWGWGRSI